MAKKLLSQFFVVASLTCISVGQAANNYVEAPQFKMVDNRVNCGGTRNCFASTRPGSLTEFSINWETGYLVGRNSAGSFYTLPYSTGSGQSWFALLSGLSNSTLHSIAAGGKNQIYALTNNSTGCPTAGTYHIVRANTSLTGWNSTGGCLSTLRASSTGSIAGLQGSAQVGWWSFNGGTSWEVVTAPSAGPWTKITPITNNFGYGIAGGCVYTMDKASGSWVTGLVGGGQCGAFDVTGSPDAVWITMITLNGSPNPVYYYNRTATSPSWHQVYNPYFLTNLTGGGDFLMALNGTQPVHFITNAPHMAEVVKGDYTCAGLCPSGSTHTASATVKWTSGGLWGNGRTVTSSGTPATTLNANAGDVGASCDLVFGDPTSPLCEVQIFGSVVCSVMGTLSNFLQEVSHPKPVLTWAYYAGTTSPEPDGFNCDTHDYCSNPPPKCPAFPVFLNRTDAGLTQDGTCRTHTPWREYQFDIEFFGRPVFCTGSFGHVPGLGDVNLAIPTFNTVTTPQPCTQ